MDGLIGAILSLAQPFDTTPADIAGQLEFDKHSDLFYFAQIGEVGCID